MSSTNRAAALAFIEGAAAGKIAKDLVTDDFVAWTTASGDMPGQHFLDGVGLLASVFTSPMRIEVDAVTAEDDRVVVEARSYGPLAGGDAYRNRYVFVFRMRGGKVASVAEHHDSTVVMEKLRPLMQASPARRGG